MTGSIVCATWCSAGPAIAARSPTGRWQRYGDCRGHASQSLVSGARTRQPGRRRHQPASGAGVTGRARRRPCTAEDARTRAAHARVPGSRQTGPRDIDKPGNLNFNHVAAGNAVLAAIAASNALCCRLLGERSRGQDHRDAVALLEQVRFGTRTDQAGWLPA
jgi:hypothetical protein